MSGSISESVDVSKIQKQHDEMLLFIKEHFPDYDLVIKEDYSLDVIKGHRVKITTLLKHRVDGSTMTIDERYFKIPKNCPKWITRHNLWHHTKDDIMYLDKLTQAAGEKNPSKKTLETWKNLMERRQNVSKTNYPQKRIPKIQ